MAGLKQLIQEIHRRSLWQVLAIYVAVAWALLEAADQFSGQFDLPGLVYRGLFAVLLVGLPIVLATAFFQRGLPAITRRDPTLLPDAGAVVAGSIGVLRLFTWRNAFIGGLFAFALWGAVSAGWLVVYGGTLAVSADDRKSVAVLPFANMSANPDDQYFTDGMHDAIIEHLAKIADLKVISRTSVMEYRNTTKNIGQIAEELGVASVLEGGVQRAGDQLRITAQLIAAESDDHLWGDSYERELTARNVFAIQGDVARQIASALRASLTPQEIERVEHRPTQNLEAYDYYLRGNDYRGRSFLEQDYRIAIRMYEEALALDPRFALAWADLARAHDYMYWFYYDRSEKRLADTKDAIDRALELDPDLPEAHLALGWHYYHGYLDYDRALQEFAIARNSLINHSEVFMGVGAIRRRQGKLVEALANFETILELDPRSPLAIMLVAETNFLLGNNVDARRRYERAIALNPDSPRPYAWKAWFHLRSEGSTGEARSVLEAAEDVGATQHPHFYLAWYAVDLFEGKYQAALQRLALTPSVALETQYYLIPKTLLYAQIYGLLKQEDLAHTYYDSARSYLQEVMRRRAEDAAVHSSLGIAAAGLGLVQEAKHEGELGVELLPMDKESWRGAYRVEDLALIYVMVGEYDAAINQLEFLLANPGELSAHWLRANPSWDPLLFHPRFQALLEKYEQ